jgi:hypothetical protein
MPFPCRVNSHMPCSAPAILRQCRVLRESPHGRREYPNCIWDWYASGNNFRGTPRGSRKKLNAGRSPKCRLWTADAISHIPCRSHAALCRGLERLHSERHSHGMAWERHGRGMACVNQTRPHCVNQMRNTQSKTLAERHGRGTAWYVWISLKGENKFTSFKLTKYNFAAAYLDTSAL